MIIPLEFGLSSVSVVSDVFLLDLSGPLAVVFFCLVSHKLKVLDLRKANLVTWRPRFRLPHSGGYHAAILLSVCPRPLRALFPYLDGTFHLRRI